MTRDELWQACLDAPTAAERERRATEYIDRTLADSPTVLDLDWCSA